MERYLFSLRLLVRNGKKKREPHWAPSDKENLPVNYSTLFFTPCHAYSVIRLYKFPTIFDLQTRHNTQQSLVAIDIMVFHMTGGNFIKQLLGTGNFGLFYGSNIHAVHRPFGFGNKVNMLH